MSSLAIIIGATLIWLAAVVSPGPNFLVVSRLALSRSRGSAIGAAFGIAVGSLIYAALTMFGLSVLILRFGLEIPSASWVAPTSSGSVSRPGGRGRRIYILQPPGQPGTCRLCCAGCGLAS